MKGGALAAALVTLGAFATAGCSLAPAARQPVQYDFGPAVVAPVRADAPAAIQVSAPAWLDSPALLYRLEYRDAAQPASYRDSRWVATPAALFSERLRERAARAEGTARAVLLRVELEEFCQAFAAPDRSRALLRLRAALIDPASGRLLRQQAFAYDVDAASADAVGGAHALARAAEQAIGELLGWAAAD